MVITWMDLKDARSVRGWTQAQLAEAIGVHQKTIVNWESSAVPPKSEYKVRRELGIELEYVDYRNVVTALGSDPDSFEDWHREYDRQDRIDAELDEGNDAPTQDQIEMEHAFRVEEAQRSYDARISEIKALAPFTSHELLSEVSRRIRLSEHRAAERAGDDSEGDDEGGDEGGDEPHSPMTGALSEPGKPAIVNLTMEQMYPQTEDA